MLVFITVISLLTLNIVQQSTQDLLLAGNVQQRVFALHATMQELNHSRTSISTIETANLSSVTPSVQDSRTTLLGCYFSPWVPLDISRTAPAESYRVYKIAVPMSGHRDPAVQAFAIVAVPGGDRNCVSN